MAKPDPLGRPSKQVFSRRGTSFLTLSTSYEEEAKVRDDEPGAMSGTALADAEPGRAGLRARLRRGVPLREVLQERVDSVREAREEFNDRLNDIGDALVLKALDSLSVMLGHGARVLGVVGRPFYAVIRRVQIVWAGEDAFADESFGDGERIPEIDFVALAEKNIFFTDNHKSPLYSMEQLRSEQGYTVSADVLKPIVMDKIYTAFKEVAPKARGLPVPDKGLYAGRPMDEVLDGITETDIALFFDYVLRFPVGYVGKNFRLTESFAGWAVSGTPDD